MTKRALDGVISAALLVILLPLLVAIAVGVKLSSRGPVLYRQTRSGRDGVEFSLVKFRSMHVGEEHPSGETWEGDPRVFPFGRLIREFHLDELPQLWNVLVGDMSLVGPRPTLPEQVEKYTPFERQRLRVKPGITGLAQVSGSNLLDWSERIKLDVDYVQNRSLWLDMKIVWRTFSTVARRDGIYGPDGRVRGR